MKRILVLVFVLLMTMCLLGGCLRNNDELNNENQAEEKKESQSEDIEKERLAETGIYMGKINDDTIKIKMQDETVSFMVTDETEKEIEGLKENEKIDFVYYKDSDGQFVLAGITEKETPEEVSKVDKGIYTGQLDNFSIEVQVGETPKVFINYEMEKILQGIEEGDEVEIKYTENEHGQLNIESLRKLN